MPDIKIDDNGLFEEERRLNAYLNSNELEQLENQHAEMDKRWRMASTPTWTWQPGGHCAELVTNVLTATAGSDVVQSGRPIFDDFFQHLWPYIGNNTANVVFLMVKRLWLIRIDQ
ncbi:hypothetical protein TNCV_1144521 [Trichonephila clavipes]|nr:hypothetical protein TNCV_1144521 [Trichonephila clavipes]